MGWAGSPKRWALSAETPGRNHRNTQLRDRGDDRREEPGGVNGSEWPMGRSCSCLAIWEILVYGSVLIDKGGYPMKIVVIGGTGLIGSKTVAILRQGGHEVVAASPNTGVNTITGEGLKEAMAGAQVVIDLANSPSFEDRAVLEFFETSGRNLLHAEAACGVGHHVALSIVGTDRTPDNGYFRAKVAQEKQ